MTGSACSYSLTLAKVGRHRHRTAGPSSSHTARFCNYAARCEAGGQFGAGEDVVNAAGRHAGRAGKAFGFSIQAAKTIDVAGVTQAANGAARDIERACAIEERAEECI